MILFVLFVWCVRALSNIGTHTHSVCTMNVLCFIFYFSSVSMFNFKKYKNEWQVTPQTRHIPNVCVYGRDGWLWLHLWLQHQHHHHWVCARMKAVFLNRIFGVYKLTLYKRIESDTKRLHECQEMRRVFYVCKWIHYYYYHIDENFCDLGTFSHSRWCCDEWPALSELIDNVRLSCFA